MKVVKYFVKLTVRDDKGDNPVKFKLVKHEKSEGGTKRKLVDAEEHPFRKLANAREFVNTYAEREGIQCSSFEKKDNVWSKECSSQSGVKYTFEIREQRIVKPKKEKKEEGKKEEKKEGGKEEAKSEQTQQQAQTQETKQRDGEQAQGKQ
ncbi:hypothetical protein [Sulfuracidifex tepidarius]|uniref:Uncharacterized protein n=1 Tax=Sulfuracidifex tepidarius TaxID=1294262 RepID=A0A510DTI0_9CREN|nr:hypothetical protein [Sulfuracidifex tepidarius]BBG23523.1 hypothetical protein IC006_0807 [Sulfuracidifex tepidarius]BBG26277.1 hypothetical protein IC007_0782 [Sulfuracidifex tepidarius]